MFNNTHKKGTKLMHIIYAPREGLKPLPPPMQVDEMCDIHYTFWPKLILSVNTTA